MNNMFQGAAAFNQNISSWNTAKVTDMNAMFSGAALFNQNIGSWSTILVTDMNGMFNAAQAFNQTIGSWNTEQVTKMNNMFNGASSVQPGHVSSWNTAKVTSDARHVQRRGGVQRRTSVHVEHGEGDGHEHHVLQSADAIRTRTSATWETTASDGP